MQMTGERSLAATQAQAWDALNDPSVLKQCIPGCESLEPIEGGFAFAVAIRIGPVAAKFKGTVTLKDVDAPNAYTLVFEAQGGVAGFGKGESRVSLETQAGGTLMRYTVSSQIGGKLAQLGQRLVDGAAKSLAEDFFKKFESALAERVAAAGESSQEPSTPPASAQSGLAVMSAQAWWLWVLLALAIWAGLGLFG
jgi:carbon monoxide dehydrogenase subunit G